MPAYCAQDRPLAAPRSRPSLRHGIRRRPKKNVTTTPDSVNAPEGAVQRAAAAYPDRLVLSSGWESDDAFILTTDSPNPPPAMRDEEEDKLVVRVDKSSGKATGGTFVAFLREFASMAATPFTPQFSAAARSFLAVQPVLANTVTPMSKPPPTAAELRERYIARLSAFVLRARRIREHSLCQDRTALDNIADVRVRLQVTSEGS